MLAACAAASKPPDATHNAEALRAEFVGLCASEMEKHYVWSFAQTPKGQSGAVPLEPVKSGAKARSNKLCQCMGNLMTDAAKGRGRGAAKAMMGPSIAFIQKYRDAVHDPKSTVVNPDLPNAMIGAVKLCGKPIIVLPPKWLYH